MSGTLAATRRRVRNHLRDLNAQDYAWPTPEVNSAINVAMVECASRLKLGDERVTTIVTLVPGTDTYSLSGSLDYARIFAFRSVATGLSIEVVSRDTLDYYREGTISAADGRGDPRICCVYETEGQTPKVQFWPNPVRSDTLDAIRATIPAELTTDAATIPFDRQGLEALAYMAAGDLCASAAPEVLASRKLGGGAAGKFLAGAAALIRASNERRAKQAGVGRTKKARAW